MDKKFQQEEPEEYTIIQIMVVVLVLVGIQVQSQVHFKTGNLFVMPNQLIIYLEY